jgi:hemolysin activation/secretion protein
VPATIYVDRFNIEGSTVFTPAQLAAVTAPYEKRNLSFAELLQARSAVTQLYVDRGYITSGAFIPPQTLEGGVVTIQVVEGSLESINITGTRRLNPAYVRSRLKLAASTPLNVNHLLEGLQLLQLNPLIKTISADLQAGTRPGTSVLQVQVAEADVANVQFSLDNGRSPSVGSFRRQIQFDHGNLIGFGDAFNVTYANTDGSNEVDTSYSIPLNPRNGTLRLAYGASASEVIEPPFDALGIHANSHYYELTFRQPLSQSPTEEFALGVTGLYQDSQTKLRLNGELMPFPLSPGADSQGRTRITAVSVFQEWTQRNSQQVLSARSQFNLGLNVLGANINDTGPDGRFFFWQGQGQYVRLLAPDTLFLVRGNAQLADGPLVPLEQFGIGGPLSVRGYRQDALLTDNGFTFSAELRIPIVRIASIDGILQVTPFIDIGRGWNSGNDDPMPGTLTGIGAGLLWRQGDNFSARLDIGIPVVSIDSQDRTWQENGIYFLVIYSPF